mmetsp:Transcript_6728/g.16742  ORF Transcript_6728/g.16742 Transcript_6728/m.16742 type:complete len:206 (-) Transcript_6728:22-639(-)
MSPSLPRLAWGTVAAASCEPPGSASCCPLPPWPLPGPCTLPALLVCGCACATSAATACSASSSSSPRPEPKQMAASEGAGCSTPGPPPWPCAPMPLLLRCTLPMLARLTPDLLGPCTSSPSTTAGAGHARDGGGCNVSGLLVPSARMWLLWWGASTSARGGGSSTRMRPPWCGSPSLPSPSASASVPESTPSLALPPPALPGRWW